MKSFFLGNFLEEIRFLRSPRDFQLLWQKLPFIIHRLTGNRAIVTRVPLSLQVEPTNFCNLRCLCCPSGQMTRPKGKMDLSLFQKIIEEASQLGIHRIHLYLHGEPFIHPQILAMVQMVKEKGLSFSIFTNGQLLDEDLAAGLLDIGLESGDYLTFSVLGASPQTYARVMKPGNFDMVEQNIKRFLSMRKSLRSNGPITQVVFYRMPENAGEEMMFKTKWKGIVDHVTVAGRISESFTDPSRERPTTINRTVTCRNLWERLVVLWNGDVPLCTQDVNGDFVFGNLKNQSIAESWNHPFLDSVRESHRSHRFDHPLCIGCDE